MRDIEFILDPEDIAIISEALHQSGVRPDLITMFSVLEMQGKPLYIGVEDEDDDDVIIKPFTTDNIDIGSFKELLDELDLSLLDDDIDPDALPADWENDFKSDPKIELDPKIKVMVPDSPVKTMADKETGIDVVVPEDDDFVTEFDVETAGDVGVNVPPGPHGITGPYAPKPEPEVEDKQPAGWDSRVPRPTFDPEYASAIGHKPIINPIPSKPAAEAASKPAAEAEKPFTPVPEPASKPDIKPDADPKPVMVSANELMGRVSPPKKEEPSFETAELCGGCGGFLAVNPHSDPNMNCGCGDDPYTPELTEKKYSNESNPTTPEANPAPAKPAGWNANVWST